MLWRQQGGGGGGAMLDVCLVAFVACCTNCDRPRFVTRRLSCPLSRLRTTDSPARPSATAAPLQPGRGSGQPARYTGSAGSPAAGGRQQQAAAAAAAATPGSSPP